MEKTWYVYLHRKLSTGDIFYVGIGCQPKYGRVFEERKRNPLWFSIARKHGVQPEIIGDFLTKKQAVELEKGVIKTLGRRDINTGSLSNMTIGGDGVSGKPLSKEHKEKLSRAHSGKNNYWWGKKLSGAHREKIRKSNTGNFVGSKHPTSKQVLHLETGVVFDCAREAAECFNIKYSTLKSMLNSTNSNRSGMMYL